MPDTETKLLGLKESILREISNLKAVSLKESFENYFNNECALNDYLNDPLVNEVVFKALERCLCRVKGYQKIDADLPDSLISEGDACLVKPKLDKIRLKLADLYANILANNTSKEPDVKNSYVEIKCFFYTVYQSDIKKVSFSNKLKIFNLLINLLEKKDDIALEKFHEEFTPLFLFIKSLIDKQKNIGKILTYPGKLRGKPTQLESYTSENILAIKKDFYSIIRDKNEKIIYQDLLEQLFNLANEQFSASFKEFSVKFVNQSFYGTDMTPSDFKLVIGLVYRALENSHRNNKKTAQNADLLFNTFKKVMGKKSLIDHLKEFETDFEEQTKQRIPNIENIGKNKVIEKFNKSLSEFNLTNVTEHKISMRYLIGSTKKFKNIAFLGGETLYKVKEHITSASENLNGIFSSVAENVKVKNDLNTLNEIKEIRQDSEGEKINLNPLKVKSSDFLKKLEILENKIYPFISKMSVTEELNISRINVNPFSLEDKGIYKKVDEYIESFKDNHSNLIQKLLNLLIVEKIKRENDWFDVNHKASLAERLFNRGYLSSNSLIKKLKSKLDKNMSFIQYKNFFKEKSFWNLLSYGLIRWPWVNKEIFSIKWAEQLCLPTVLDLKEQLLNFPLMLEEDSLEKILSLSKYLNPDKIILFDQQLMKFKQNIITYKSKIEMLDKEIDKLKNQAKEVNSSKPVFIEAWFFPSAQTSSKDPTESPIPKAVNTDLNHIYYNVR